MEWIVEGFRVEIVYVVERLPSFFKNSVLVHISLNRGPTLGHAIVVNNRWVQYSAFSDLRKEFFITQPRLIQIYFVRATSKNTNIILLPRINFRELHANSWTLLGSRCVVTYLPKDEYSEYYTGKE
eukprot:03468_2